MLKIKNFYEHMSLLGYTIKAKNRRRFYMDDNPSIIRIYVYINNTLWKKTKNN
jgi:hypothetical protein